MNQELPKFKIPSKEEFEKILKEREEKQKKLLASEKRPEELIEHVTGLVKKVIGSNQMEVISYPNKLYFDTPKLDPSEYGFYLEIKLKSKAPVETLFFYGFSPIREGDSIRAYVVKGKKETLPSPIYHRGCGCGAGEFTKADVLVRGNFKKEMIALQIDILKGEKTIRTDYGSNFDSKTKDVSEPFLL